MPPTSIKHWREDDRPREKLLHHGEHTLSDSELLAILLGSGRRGQTAVDLARRILETFGTFRNMSHTTRQQWDKFPGVGDAKLARIRAAVEIARRFSRESREVRPCIKSSRDVADLMMPRLRDLKKEVFKVLLLNTRNRVIGTVEVDEGGVDRAHPQIREIMNRALEHYATGLVAVHNHPSGDPSPSREDISFTHRLSRAGQIMEVRILDHLIIGDDRYFSFADRGLLTAPSGDNQ